MPARPPGGPDGYLAETGSDTRRSPALSTPTRAFRRLSASPLPLPTGSESAGNRLWFGSGTLRNENHPQGPSTGFSSHNHTDIVG